MCRAVLGRETGFAVKVGPVGATVQRITIAQVEPAGVPLTVDGETHFRLLAQYRCAWNSDQRFFAIESSSITVHIEGVNEPFFHVDYARDGSETVPVAHLNVHAHRDEVVWAMLMARTKRGKARHAAAARGTITRISALHFPLGGHRFRPGLEDVLEMMINEFGIDRAPVAITALRAGRRRFRAIQVSSAVADDPETAAEALRRIGYVVTAPPVLPSAREDRLAAY